MGYTKNTPNVGSGQPSFTWTRACAAGDTIILIASHQGTNSITVTDNSSGTNTWVKCASTFDATTPATSARLMDVWRCTPTVAITSITTASVGSTNTYWVLQAKDYAGTKTLRGTPTTFMAGTTTQPGAISVVSGDTLILACAYNASVAGSVQETISNPTGWSNTGENNPAALTPQSTMWELTASATAATNPSVTASPSTQYGLVFLALAGANVAPTVTPGATQTVAAGTVVTFSCTATDPDGTIATLTGAITGPVTPTLTGSATGTGTASAALSQTATLNTIGKYTWTATAVDNVGGAGGTATGSTIAYVYPVSGTFGDPVAVTVGTWTNVAGATALTSITDANAGTYLESPASPGGASFTTTLAPMGPGSLEVDVEGYYSSGALNRTLTLFKADGVTTVDTITYALPSSDTVQVWNIGAGGLATIPNATDRQALILKVADA